MNDTPLTDLELHSIRRELAQSFEGCKGAMVCGSCRQIISLLRDDGIFVSETKCGVCSRTSPTGAAREGS